LRIPSTPLCIMAFCFAGTLFVTQAWYFAKKSSHAGTPMASAANAVHGDNKASTKTSMVRRCLNRHRKVKTCVIAAYHKRFAKCRFQWQVWI
jgi:hypothetical protein